MSHLSDLKREKLLGELTLVTSEQLDHVKTMDKRLDEMKDIIAAQAHQMDVVITILTKMLARINRANDQDPLVK